MSNLTCFMSQTNTAVITHHIIFVPNLFPGKKAQIQQIVILFTPKKRYAEALPSCPLNIKLSFMIAL